MEFPSFYGNEMFIILFTRVRHLFLAQLFYFPTCFLINSLYTLKPHFQEKNLDFNIIIPRLQTKNVMEKIFFWTL